MARFLEIKEAGHQRLICSSFDAAIDDLGRQRDLAEDEFNRYLSEESLLSLDSTNSFKVNAYREIRHRLKVIDDNIADIRACMIEVLGDGQDPEQPLAL